MLSNCVGDMLLATLIRHLNDCIVYDCAVRDMLTIGHLAKLLCRIDILKTTSNPAIVGLPNVLFDKRSQQDRRDCFAKPGMLPVNGELLEIGIVKEMLQREASTATGS